METKKLFHVVHPNGSPWTNEEVEDYIAENSDYLEVRNFYSFHIDDKNRLFIKDSFGTVDEVTDRDTFKVEFENSPIISNEIARDAYKKALDKIRHVIDYLESIYIYSDEFGAVELDYFLIRDFKRQLEMLEELDKEIDLGIFGVMYKDDEDN